MESFLKDIDRYLHEFETALIDMDRDRARRIFMLGVESDGPIPLLENLVSPVLDHIGSLWESGRLALSQVYLAGRICEDFALTVLPAGSHERHRDPSIALAVFEDYHTLGKRMVHAVLRAEGYAVSDWGQVDRATALELLRAEGVEILLLSCLMLSSALRIAQLHDAIESEGLAIKLVVGGAPFRLDPDLWREVGADAMGSTASQVTDLVKSFTGEAE